MANGDRGTTLRDLGRLFGEGTLAGLDEGQLLDRFADRRDEAAFRILLARHGPMVLATCRRMLRDEHDAEDAFQATFLVLARKAGSLRCDDRLGGWLHGVAFRVASRSRSQSARRRTVETSGGLEQVPDPVKDGPGAELVEEVHRLPESYRLPIVLCYLEGLTHEEAARQLRWPIGTVKGRLSRARDLLRSRLTRRGLAISAGLLSSNLARGASAAFPSHLSESTIRAATLVAAGEAIGAGTVPATVAALYQGVLNAMFLTKLKIGGAAIVVTVALIATGEGVRAQFGGTGKAIAPKSSPRPEPAPDDPAAGVVSALRANRTKAASLAYATALAEYQQGRGDINRVYQWSRRVLDSQSLPDDADRKDEILARQGHLDRMRELEQWETKNAATGLRGGSTFGASAAEFYRIEAELWLAEAKAGRSSLLDVSFESGAIVRGPGTIITPGELNSPFALEMKDQDDGGGAFGGAGEATARTWTLEDAAKDPENAAILDQLEMRIPIQFPDDTPLSDVLKYIKAATDQTGKRGIPIYVDPAGLSNAERNIESPVSLDLEGIRLKTTLRLILKQLNLVYYVRDGLLIITDYNDLAEVEIDAEPAR